ncbi:MAG: cytochrome P450 [Conexibacter sp.]
MRSAEAGGGLPPSPPLPGALQTGLLWRWPFSFLTTMRRRYGSRFTIHALARPPLVFLSDLAEAKQVFATSPEVLRPGEGGATIMPIVGERSFMLADGETHWRDRAMLSPAFSQRAVEEHAEAVRELAEREVASWPRDVPFALHDRLRAMTLRVILHTLFGRDIQHVPELHGRLLSMLAMTAGVGLTLPVSRSLPGGRASWRQFLADRDAVDAMLLRLVEARRERASGHADVLATLVAARDADAQPLPAGYVRDSLMSLILAGHETTAAELCWAFQLLAHNPRVQDRLAGELAAGNRGYLPATVLEVLRHRPVFLFAIPRAVAAPIAIGGWTYEPPAQWLVCIYLLHHDPAAFPSPNQFRPERFLDERTDASWLPWGGGRKRCPGRRLALLELETVLAIALSAVSVHPAAPAPERPRWRSVIVTPHAGSRVILRDRRPRAPDRLARHS